MLVGVYDLYTKIVQSDRGWADRCQLPVPIAFALILASSSAPALAASHAHTGYAQIGPLSMYYEIHGQGKPLLLLHGGGSTISTTFGEILPALARDRMVIAPEQQGHGHTADIARSLTYRQMADDTAELLRQLRVEPVDVIGFSNGAGVAMELALRYPDLVDNIVLCSIYYRRDAIKPELLASFKAATAGSMPAVYREAYLQVAPHPGDLDKLTPKLMANILGFEGWSPAELARIQSRVMIVQANNDIAPLEHISDLAKAIPESQVVVLPGGHGSYLGEVLARIQGSALPQITLTLISEFFASDERETAQD